MSRPRSAIGSRSKLVDREEEEDEDEENQQEDEDDDIVFYNEGKRVSGKRKNKVDFITDCLG
jgi:hypothetical protein